jgi:hypothetical protein
MSSDLTLILVIYAGYLAIAAGLALFVWRLARRLHSPGLRLGIRALTLAVLFSPGVAACGGAAIVPFSLVLFGDTVNLISPNGCTANTPWNLRLFLPALALCVAVLFILERRRHRVDAL